MGELSNGKKLFGSLSVVVAVVLGAGWFFLDSYVATNQAYEGKIVSRAKQRNWLRGARKPGQPEYRYYRYYWYVECANGKTRKVKVPRHQYNEGKTGLPVKKVQGDRYPTINTPEALENRALKQEAIGHAVDAMKQKVLGR